MARPPLPRFRAILTVAVELSAEDEDHANQRLEALADLVRPRIKASIRGARIGSAEVLTVEAAGTTARL